MQSVIEEATGEKLTVCVYQEFIGKETSEGPFIPPKVVCISEECRNEMRLRAAGLRVAHFFHLAGAKTCPSSIAAAKQYQVLKPTDPDVAAGKALREVFKHTWERHFIQFRDLTEHASIHEFVAALEVSLRYRIWEYKDVQEWHIPYLLATLIDFPVATSRPRDGKPMRTFWRRLWLHGAKKTLESRWNDASELPELYHAWFKDDGKSRPTRAMLEGIDRRKMVPMLGNGPLRAPGSYVQGVMRDWFRSHPRLF